MRSAATSVVPEPAKASNTTSFRFGHVKRRDELHDDVVQAKARAAAKWVGYANAHAKQCNGKTWVYALIPHDAVNAAATLKGLVASHAMQALV